MKTGWTTNSFLIGSTLCEDPLTAMELDAVTFFEASATEPAAIPPSPAINSLRLNPETAQLAQSVAEQQLRDSVDCEVPFMVTPLYRIRITATHLSSSLTESIPNVQIQLMGSLTSSLQLGLPTSRMLSHY